MFQLSKTCKKLYSTVSSSKPLLHDILPSKKVISRLLFDYDARYNFNKYLPVVESIYDSLPEIFGNEPKIPDKFKGNDLLIFQRVLAQIRKQTHAINPLLLKLENELIEHAAERGSRDALCTLSFMALNDSGEGWTEDDKITAKKYIKDLMEMQHPLVFKLAADRELKGFTKSLNEKEEKDLEEQGLENESKILETEDSTVNLSPTSDMSFSNITSSPKQLTRAISLYHHFLTLDSKSTVAAAAHRSLGMIYFRTQELIKSHEHFRHAINLAPVSDNSQAHFFLGLLNEIDPIKARYHFQMAATEGFRESFANLGYIELNVFNELNKSKEWFALGAELGVPECIVGLFDVSVRKQDWNNAKNILIKAERQGLSDMLNEVRKTQIERVKRETDFDPIVQKQHTEESNSSQSRNSRWDL
ncbi:hypothetical protein C6P40_004142 [Pichia californica]|uniref:Protein MSS2, mitochondrial n=1 Tax=Pichia californica TaxID=460514 RepID=A0A9P6WPW2_9ASCO|nr:hypothetical protein C6P42_003913 [[Candida] californica]KAG0689968.1 hypothetical protein C6P40_004142 [[Candida] californica]